MRPLGLEQLVELEPGRIVLERAPKDDMAEDEALAHPRPAADHAFEPVVLRVDANADEQNLRRDAIEPERLRCGSSSALSSISAPASTSSLRAKMVLHKGLQLARIVLGAVRNSTANFDHERVRVQSSPSAFKLKARRVPSTSGRRRPPAAGCDHRRACAAPRSAPCRRGQRKRRGSRGVFWLPLDHAPTGSR